MLWIELSKQTQAPSMVITLTEPQTQDRGDGIVGFIAHPKHRLSYQLPAGHAL